MQKTGSIFRLAATLLACSCLMLGGLPPAPAPSPFAPGETLTFNVSWSVFPAGTVVATLKQQSINNQDAYVVDTVARSRGFVSLLFNLRDDLHSVFNPATLCSEQITKSINEGRRHRQTKIVFDNVRHVAILDETDPTRASQPPKHVENPIPACAEDIVTGFYYLRSQPIQVGKSIKVYVNDGSTTHEVVVEVQARERIDTHWGPRYAFRLEPRVFGDLFKRKGRMLIWISDDAQRLPLRIKAMILVGDIVGDLQSVTTTPSSGNSK